MTAMKKLILILVILFSANAVTGQECAKKCEKANKYAWSDGLIKATMFHENGTIAQTGFYTTENKLQGEWISYDTNGNKTAIAHYNEGMKVGTWKFMQGNLIKEVEYNKSKISLVKTWELTDTRVVLNLP